MTKLVTGVFLIYFTIIQFYSVSGLDNATDPTDLIAEDRFLFGGMIRSKCRAQLNARSTVLPNLGVSLTRLGGRQYFFSPAAPVANHLTFAEAVIFCRDHGMHLVTINSADENLLVYARATTAGIAQAGAPLGAWIGYRDVTGAGNYQWVYRPKVGTPPTFFAAGQPVNGLCAGYTQTIPPAGVPTPVATSWTTYACNVARPFICEMEPPCSLVL